MGSREAGSRAPGLTQGRSRPALRNTLLLRSLREPSTPNPFDRIEGAGAYQLELFDQRAIRIARFEPRDRQVIRETVSSSREALSSIEEALSSIRSIRRSLAFDNR